MSTVEVKQLEQSIKQSQKAVELGESLARLLVNRDFKKVISEGLFEQEAIRLVHAKAEPDNQSEVSQKLILSKMDAIGALKEYFSSVAQKALLAEKSIAADEQMLDTLLEEGI